MKQVMPVTVATTMVKEEEMEAKEEALHLTGLQRTTMTSEASTAGVFIAML
jgi:hypothetical protein